ncbi:BapA prefix-like domain-containing protein, partial [Ignatzschineria indica]|uniref:BapA/Bap/LapF family prefix-like domain-containing protein n=1 Tax=Ignatzschineria indica TaxID=472583 RepID=UPI0025768255
MSSSTFLVVNKKSSNEVTVNSSKIVLNDASIVHTGMYRADVAEFIQEGNNLVLKLKNGQVIVIENFFLLHDDLHSDLLFEDDEDGIAWLPLLAGGVAAGGLVAALSSSNDKDGSISAEGSITVGIDTKNNQIFGSTTEFVENGLVTLIITGSDIFGNVLERTVTTTVDAEGNYSYEIPSDFADGDIFVKATTTDRKGVAHEAITEDVLDRLDGYITVDVTPEGEITGTTQDVKPDSDVKLTITGQDINGDPLEKTVTVRVDENGEYRAEVPEEFADGELTVKAEAIDRNGKDREATNKLEFEDHDKDRSTPDQGGLDRTEGSISVEIDLESNQFVGQTVDIPAKGGDEVTLVITGVDKNGDALEQTVTTTIDAEGNYRLDIPAEFADGGIGVVATATDRNNQPLSADDNKTLDRLDGEITVAVTPEGEITGTTQDVKPGDKVTLTIIGQDKDGKLLVNDVDVTVEADGSYKATVPGSYADGDLYVEAKAKDRNGNSLTAKDNLLWHDHDDNPETPDQGGLDRTEGSISVAIDLESNQFVGKTVDVPARGEVTLVITGVDKKGDALTQTVTTTIDAEGNYRLDIPAEFADGAIDVVATA